MRARSWRGAGAERVKRKSAQRDAGRVQAGCASRVHRRHAPAAPRLLSTAAVMIAPCNFRSSQPAAAPHPVPTAHSPPWPFVRLSARVTKRSSRSSQTSSGSSSNSSSNSGAEAPPLDDGTSSSSAGAKPVATTAGRLSSTPRAGCARSRTARVVACRLNIFDSNRPCPSRAKSFRGEIAQRAARCHPARRSSSHGGCRPRGEQLLHDAEHGSCDAPQDMGATSSRCTITGASAARCGRGLALSEVHGPVRAP